MYCKEAEVYKARALFDLMREKGLYSDVITYNTLLDGYCLCGQMDEAKNLMDLMINDGCKLDTDGEVAEARALFDSMSKRSLVLDVITYTALLDGYCLHGELHEA
ncbi:hypothetical protein RDABS01_019456 [Bienertia sinuspersici]